MTQKSLLGSYSDPTGTYTFTGLGLVPIGAVIPIANSAAWSLPAADEIKDGYALCNGSSFPAGSHASLTGNRPDLTDDRFLNGSTSTGITGGATSKTTTGITASFNKNVMNTNQILHNHRIGAKVGSTLYLGGNRISNPSVADGGDLPPNQVFDYYTTMTWPSSQAWSVTNTTEFYTTDEQYAVWASATVNAVVDQGTISDIRPKYLNVVYVMRVI